MENYTKGKWETTGVARKDVLGPAFYHVDVICNDTIRVAKSSGVGEENALANACLIAAAPDLLAGCKDALEYLRANPDEYSEPRVEKLTITIKKALNS